MKSSAPASEGDRALRSYLEYLSGWIAERVKAAGAKGAVVGVSGGVDSALVASLAVKALGKAALGLGMWIDNTELDARAARSVAKTSGIAFKEIDLKPAFEALAASLKLDEADRVVLGNAKARLRMTTLYAHAQANNLLVLGTDNAAESYTGYFTKYGDGGVDVLPIVRLTKGQVRRAAEMLGVDPLVTERAPTASLWDGQTDEGEMGLTYEQLDRYLLGGEATAGVKAKIESMHERSAHKRDPLPKPKPFAKVRE